MSKPWVKSWVCSLNKPKIMSLPPDEFKCWQILQWIAGEYDRDGLLPPIEECAFIMHIAASRCEDFMVALLNRKLLDKDGDEWRMHDWLIWQARKPSDEPEAVLARVRKSRGLPPDGVTRRNAIQNDTQTVTSRNARNAVKSESESESENRGELKKTVTDVTVKESAAARRGAARMPEQWPAAADVDAMLQYGASKGLAPAATTEHIMEYHDFWTQATRNATSLDWVKRWRSKLSQDVREGRLGGKATNGHRPVTYAEVRQENSVAAFAAVRAIYGGQGNGVPDVRGGDDAAVQRVESRPGSGADRRLLGTPRRE